MDENKLWQIAFNHLISFNFNQYNLLLKYFGNFKEAFYAHSSDLRLAGLREKTIEQLLLKRKAFNLCEKLEFINKENISVCFYEDPNYPIFLKNIFSPSPLLYYRGNLNIDWKMSLSVVGARNYSYYGERIINNFIPKLVEKSINIISGLALGIDSLAHTRSIESGGQTVAVLGSGIDDESIYPFQNKKLFYDIIANNGLVLSEFCPRTKPVSFNFPQRNRIIAGLSMSTLVVEAGEKSGSLITANQALEEGRNVLVFPGDVYNYNFIGANNLIKNGAYLINNLDDICQFFLLGQNNINQKEKENDFTKKFDNSQNKLELDILKILKKGACHVDRVIELTGANISEISAILMVWEIGGVIKDLGGKNYILA